MKKLFLIVVFYTQFFYAQNTDQVLAQNGNLKYTQELFNKSLRYVEFLIGYPMQEQDKQLMLQETLQNFNQNPQAIINEVENIDRQMQQLYQITDVMQIARMRSALIAQIYINAQQNPQMAQSFIVRVLNAYVPLLAIDAQNLLAFTYKDFEGYAKMIQLNAILTGQYFQPTQQELIQLKDYLTQQFYNMNVEQKQALCSMQLLADYTYKVYQQMTPQQRQQLQQQYTQAYASTQTYQSGFPAGVNTPEQQQAYMREKQRQYNGNSAAMKIYYDTMMGNHATMLNVFSNYDSNTYWEYKY